MTSRAKEITEERKSDERNIKSLGLASLIVGMTKGYLSATCQDSTSIDALAVVVPSLATAYGLSVGVNEPVDRAGIMATGALICAAGSLAVEGIGYAVGYGIGKLSQ